MSKFLSFSKKQHLIISISVTLLFVLIIRLLGVPVPIFRLVVPIMLAFVGIISLYNYFYLKKNGIYNFWLWLRFPMFILSWFGVFFLLGSSFSKILFIIVSLPLVASMHNLIGHSGQQIGWNEFLITLALLLLGLFGLSFYFLIPGLLYMTLVFFSVALVARSSLEMVPHSNLKKWVASLGLGLFAVEFFWAMNFLPLHYTALAVLTFNILYVAWILYYHYLYHTLNFKQIQFNLIFAIALSAIILIATPWTIQA